MKRSLIVTSSLVAITMAAGCSKNQETSKDCEWETPDECNAAFQESSGQYLSKSQHSVVYSGGHPIFYPRTYIAPHASTSVSHYGGFGSTGARFSGFSSAGG